MSRSEAARRVGVTAQTLRRWAQDGLVPQARDGRWPRAAVAQARIVARLRERGHSLAEIRAATDSGRLAFGFVDELMPAHERTHTLEAAAADTGLEPALIERVFLSMGFNTASVERLSDDDLELLRHVAVVLAAGFPLVALLQLVRVYGQALAQMADAEVRLFQLYVHEPLMREGVPGVRMGEEMEELARELLPLASPIMDRVHQRFLAHFIEQDVIGHMESDLEGAPLDLGRLRVAIAFADLAGYTRLTEEEGEEEAVDAVERFIEDVEVTLPEGARVIKTIGDGVMIVGSDAAALVDWAVGFQRLVADRRPLPRIGMHYGPTLYRDGDYYGREVNQAARVAARARAGEVLVTRAIVDQSGPHLEFERIGEVRLKGFDHATELFVARAAPDDG
jgi:adenylate cyclase